MKPTDAELRSIGVYVAPEMKTWVKREAEKRKWSMSLLVGEIIREAMEREERRRDEIN